MRHLLTLSDLRPAEIERVFAVTSDLREKFERGIREPLLPGRVMALLFEKPSLRTRVSFEAGMQHLGGGSLFLGPEAGWGGRESAADFARVLSGYVDVIVVRAARHETAETLAAHSACPVINGLTDVAHPCQALADLYTLRSEVGRLAGLKLAFVGDGNNVARCLARGAAALGMHFTLVAPRAYWFDETWLADLQAAFPQTPMTLTEEIAEGLSGAAAVYTDVWTSMGQEAEASARRAAFGPYQVNAALMQQAPRDAMFMHCMPARRGEEVTDEVIDGPRSLVLSQAANRMHAQKGLLAWLLARPG